MPRDPEFVRDRTAPLETRGQALWRSVSAGARLWMPARVPPRAKGALLLAIALLAGFLLARQAALADLVVALQPE